MEEEKQLDAADESVEQPEGADKPETPAEKAEEEKDWKAEALKYKAIADRKEKRIAELKQSVNKLEPVDVSGLKQEIEELKLSQLNIQEKEILDEVRRYAQLNNVSYKDAANSDYIKYKTEMLEQKRKVEEASITPKPRATGVRDFSRVTPSEFDVSTEDGRQDWENYKKWLKTQG